MKTLADARVWLDNTCVRHTAGSVPADEIGPRALLVTASPTAEFTRTVAAAAWPCCCYTKAMAAVATEQYVS